MRRRGAPGGPQGGRIPLQTAATRSGPHRLSGVWPAVGLAHLASTLWLFGPLLFGGRLLYFRDLSIFYAPQYAFAARSLQQGVWPLWNPLANAGEPFLLTYPVDLLLLLVGGWKGPLGVGVALHLPVALVGASLLARRVGMGPLGAWLAGTVYGLGGFFLSLANLLPLFQSAAWAPLVAWAFVGAASKPTGRRLAVLAILLAVQVSTLGAEIVVQTLAVALTLAMSRGFWRDHRRLARLLGAGILAALLAAPAVLGIRAVLEGTARGGGFPLGRALAFSRHPVTMGEILLPKFLGEPHAFSDRDFWGRDYFPTGYPYLTTVYLGLPVLILAAGARRDRRLWILAALGFALALGRHGPLGLLPPDLRLPFRGPQKFLFLTHFALALLAGRGLDRALRADGPRWGRRTVALALPGVALVAAALALHLRPGAVRDLLAVLAPPLLDARGLVAARELWPSLWLSSGLLALGAGLALARGGRLAVLAAGLAAADLLTVNGAVNPSASASFYDLRPEVAELVRPAAEEGSYRWYSYGVAHTRGLRFEPWMARAPSDVWLYYLDRQALLPRTPALDGLEGAFDLDRNGRAPEGSTLTDRETDPVRFAEIHPRLRRGNVRWVLSFRPLPEDLVRRRGEVKLPEIRAPLVLYELRRPLPRAFWVPGPGQNEPPAGPDAVDYRRLDAHTVELRARTPPGFIVVLDGYHPSWVAEGRSGPVPLGRVPDRYRVLPTPGGEQAFTLRFRPAWPGWALALTLLGLAGVALLVRR